MKRINKRRSKVIVLSGIVILSLVASVSITETLNVNATKGIKENSIEAIEETEAENEEGNLLIDVLTNQANQMVESDYQKVEKEETVYVKMKPDGEINKILVSNWLKNYNGEEKISDYSELENIKNVKGDEIYQKGKDNTVTWSANGKEIFYQGETNKQLPITMKITYYLDDVEMAPEDLIGKSGSLKIKFNYTNNEKQEIIINQKKEEIYVPFAVISGMILPKDHFANVTVTNGKVLTDGNRNIVIGLAFPGLSDSLKIEKEKSNEDIAIPETITICADVTEFTLEMSATIVTNNILSAIGLDNLASENKIDVVQGDVNKVGEVTNSLVSGTSDLKEGISTLNDKMGDFRIGANTLNEGIQAYTDGTNQLAEGINKLGGGVGTLSNGVVTLNSGIKEAKVGADSIVNGIMAAQDGNPSPLQISESLVSGSESLAIGISEMKTKIEGIQTAFQEISNAIQGMSLEYNILINKSSEEMTAEELAFLDSYNNLIQVLGIIQGSDMSGIDQLLAGCQQLQMGTNGMNIAINTILNGSKSLQTGLEKLTNGGNELQTGVSTLSCGIQEIQNGANNLIGKNNDLQKGASQISVASTQLANGTNQLKEGATLLDDGMIQFDKEAISKLIDAFDGDLNSFYQRFQKIYELEESYNSYSGIKNDMKGTVKFIMQTDSVFN